DGDSQPAGQAKVLGQRSVRHGPPETNAQIAAGVRQGAAGCEARNSSAREKAEEPVYGEGAQDADRTAAQDPRLAQHLERRAPVGASPGVAELFGKPGRFLQRGHEHLGARLASSRLPRRSVLRSPEVTSAQ